MEATSGIEQPFSVELSSPPEVRRCHSQEEALGLAWLQLQAAGMQRSQQEQADISEAEAEEGAANNGWLEAKKQKRHQEGGGQYACWRLALRRSLSGACVGGQAAAQTCDQQASNSSCPAPARHVTINIIRQRKSSCVCESGAPAAEDRSAAQPKRKNASVERPRIVIQSEGSKWARSLRRCSCRALARLKREQGARSYSAAAAGADATSSSSSSATAATTTTSQRKSSDHKKTRRAAARQASRCTERGEQTAGGSGNISGPFWRAGCRSSVRSLKYVRRKLISGLFLLLSLLD